jgi:hypothetical protein
VAKRSNVKSIKVSQYEAIVMELLSLIGLLAQTSLSQTNQIPQQPPATQSGNSRMPGQVANQQQSQMGTQQMPGLNAANTATRPRLALAAPTTKPKSNADSIDSKLVLGVAVMLWL